ncbi:MAG: hypothetical protein EZS28_039029, partial [Streblomastix strix]
RLIIESFLIIVSGQTWVLDYYCCLQLQLVIATPYLSQICPNLPSLSVMRRVFLGLFLVRRCRLGLVVNLFSLFTSVFELEPAVQAVPESITLIEFIEQTVWTAVLISGVMGPHLLSMLNLYRYGCPFIGFFVLLKACFVYGLYFYASLYLSQFDQSLS